MTDQESKLDVLVLQRARAGDHAAFRELVRLYDAGLRALAFRLLGDRGRMDDVLQEAYVKAHRGLATFRGDASVRTWLYRITYNACMDELRHPRREELSLETEPNRAPSAPGPCDRSVARAGLSAALAVLPPDQRAAVVLVDAEGLDYAAAAGVLGVAEGTIASRVSRARAALRKALGDGERETA